MRLGNAEDAKVAAEQIGTQHRFVLSQFTDTVGASVSDTAGDSYSSTVGAADSWSASVSRNETSGRSRGCGRTTSGAAPFAPRTGSGSREVSESHGTSDSESISEGISTSTSWGVSTSRAIGLSESLGTTAQRSREFLVEAHELQQLPPSAAVVSYASRAGRQVVLADTNPAIGTLPAGHHEQPGADAAGAAGTRGASRCAGELAGHRRRATAEPRAAAAATRLAQAPPPLSTQRTVVWQHPAMATHIALLRGINVGGRNKVAMASLRDVVTSLGHADVVTYIQSGNVVFTAGEPEPDCAALASQLEQAITAALGVRPAVVVLSRADLAQTVRDSPYTSEPNPKCVHAVFFPQVPAGLAAALRAGEQREAERGGRDSARLVGRTLFVHTPDGFGRSDLALYLLNRRASPAATGTARNWVTVTKLLTLCGS
jgi:uncharacterized protein (DUF1697 family)